MEVVTETLNADRSSLFLHDAETGELFSRVHAGRRHRRDPLPLPDLGIAGSVFTSGEAEIIADAYADPRFNQDVDRTHRLPHAQHPLRPDPQQEAAR